MSQWVTSKGEDCRILGWCQIVLRWSELPITTSARIYASSNSIPFHARLQLFSFLLQLSWLSFDLAIWAHFLKFLEKRGSMKIKWYWTDPATLSALASHPKATTTFSCIQFMTFAMNISSSMPTTKEANFDPRSISDVSWSKQLMKPTWWQQIHEIPKTDFAHTPIFLVKLST